MQRLKHVTVFCFALILASATWHTGAFLVQQGLRQIGGVAEQEFAEFQKSCERAAMHAIVKRAIGPEAYAAIGGHVIDVVKDAGARGDGTDDGPEIQIGVDRVESRGGAIYLPENLNYGIGTEVVIQSYKPVWIVSAMQSTSMGGLEAHVESSIIRPLGAITNMFRWVRPSGETNAFENGGGGMIGLTIADVTGTSTVRTHAISSAAVYVEDAGYFTIRDCLFGFLKGRAIRLGNTVYCYLHHVNVRNSGDTGLPALHVQGIAGAEYNEGFAGAYLDDYLSENNYSTHITNASSLNCRNSYFENTTQNTQFIASTGTVNLTNNVFANPGSANPLSIAGAGDKLVANKVTGGATSTGPLVSSSGNATTIHDLYITDGSAADVALLVAGSRCQISNIMLIGTGGVSLTGSFGTASDIFSYSNQQPDGQFQIDLGAGWILNGFVIEGATTAVADGVRCSTSGSTVQGGYIVNLATNTNGIVSRSAIDVIANNSINGIAGTGAAIVYVNGTRAKNNQGGGGFATAAGGAVTLNAECGRVLSEVLTTAAGADYTLTMTNAMMATGSIVNAQVGYMDATAGTPQIIKTVRNGGSVVFTIRNIHASAAINGATNSLAIDFQITNP